METEKTEPYSWAINVWGGIAVLNNTDRPGTWWVSYAGPSRPDAVQVLRGADRPPITRAARHVSIAFQVICQDGESFLSGDHLIGDQDVAQRLFRALAADETFQCVMDRWGEV